MKIKTRLATAFLAITVLPMLLIFLVFWGLRSYQMDAFRKTYGLTEQVDLLSGNSVQVFNRLTRKSQEEIRKALQSNPDQCADKEFLDFVNL